MRHTEPHILNCVLFCILNSVFCMYLVDVPFSTILLNIQCLMFNLQYTYPNASCKICKIPGVELNCRLFHLMCTRGRYLFCYKNWGLRILRRLFFSSFVFCLFICYWSNLSSSAFFSFNLMRNWLFSHISFRLISSFFEWIFIFCFHISFNSKNLP